MVAYTTALNWLLEPVPGRQHRCGVRLDEVSVLVFWTNVAEFGELVADMLSEPWESVLDSGVRTAKSPWTGSTMDAFTKRGDLFCAAVLSSAQGRAVVRDYSESAVSAVSASLTKWRNSFDRVRLSVIVEVLGLHGNDMRALAAAALFGRPLPRKLLVKAIARIKNPSKSKDKVDARQLALKVIKYMVSSRTNSYSLGRLFAVLESIQRAAMGALDKTIADKHFSRCMTNPALVFPGLLKLSVHHEQKIDGSWPRVKKLAVLEEIQGFPIRLTLEEQGEFALGYAHESAFKKTQTNQTDNKDNGDSDEAV
jgi:CRISPR-associated protein Csd1